MAAITSHSTFVRPPGSPVYTNKGPALVLARRPATPSIRGTRAPMPELRDATTLEISRQIAQVIALIRATEGFDLQSPQVDKQNDELARSLQELEMKLAERERLVEEREFSLADRERDLAEAEVLLKHHEALLAASRRTPAARVGLSEEERFALVNLKTEMDRQEAVLREAREELRERALFIEESEKRLFEKVQEHQEKETEIEQREEELKRAESAKAEKKPFDEFRE
jgi:septal ring factor EnvC (AmiA/AmiB activator)